MKVSRRWETTKKFVDIDMIVWYSVLQSLHFEFRYNCVILSFCFSLGLELLDDCNSDYNEHENDDQYWIRLSTSNRIEY